MIAKNTIKFFGVLALVFSSLSVFSQAHHETEEHLSGRMNKPEHINLYIQHHLKDAHDFHVFSYTDDAGNQHHVSFPLPVITWTSKGLKAFMSSEFHHNDDGTHIVDKGDLKLVKIHGVIHELKKGETVVSFDEHHHPTNTVKVLDFSITKSVVGMLLAGLLLFLGFGSLAKSYKKGAIPTGIGRLLEPLVLYVRDDIARPNIGEKKYKKFMPYLLTVFFFIWVLNLLGLTPLGFNVTGQIAVTVCLGVVTGIVYLSNSTKDFWMHVLWMPGVPVILRPVLAIVELLGFLVIKPFSLLIRLYANITAGHFVVMSLIALMITLKTQFGVVGSTSISFVLAMFISLIEVLVAFLQAYIFTMLSSLFIGMAVEEHEHH